MSTAGTDSQHRIRREELVCYFGGKAGRVASRQVSQVGLKGWGLIEASRAGVAVPGGMIFTVNACIAWGRGQVLRACGGG